MKYNPQKIEPKWQRAWETAKLHSPNLDRAPKPFYNLMMFPYPSAAGLHVGHVYAFAGADTFGRFMRRRGFDVFEPMGFDAFGIHAENYALKANKHPKALIEETTRFFREAQLKKLGIMFDWSREINTTKPQYYKWNQWLFLQLFKAGLAERKKAPANWCPSCKTVLSDEQAAGGHCERCDSIVARREIEQWFLKITKYAERLHQNLEKIDWSENVKKLQRAWIGRSEGAKVQFWVPDIKQSLPVFTTRPDTIFGVSFIALAPDHPLQEKLIKPSEAAKVGKFLAAARQPAPAESAREKKGVFTGTYALNPINGEKVPVWLVDYVLAHYGGGAIMGVPAHDSRDFEFARKYELPIIKVVVPPALAHVLRNPEDIAAGAVTAWRVETDCYEGEGELINSGQFTGLNSVKARPAIIDWLKEKKLGQKAVTYRLRDWLISRQRYWGTPIPIAYCRKCWENQELRSKNQVLRVGVDYIDIAGDKYAVVPIPEKDLPVRLPKTENFRPTGTGKSPLAAIDSFINTRCPKCGGSAKRETDVMDNFVDSSWYFLRYPSVEFNDRPFDKKRTRKWLPVDMYIGGAEHAVLHLMYTRFITIALHGLGHLSFSEPFKKFRAHGLITKDGAKMSKSKGNVVNPDEYIKEYGADALRLYLLFLGPYDQGGDFSDTGIKGATRFLEKVWRLCSGIKYSEFSVPRERKAQMHKTIAAVTSDISELKFNTAIARLMEYVNFLQAQAKATKQERDTLLALVTPFAPHIAEELYQLGRKGKKFISVHDTPWPKFDKRYLVAAKVKLAVQINGKTRDVIEVEAGLNQTQAEQTARASAKAAKWLAGKAVRKIIYIPDKLISFVVG